MTPDPSPADPEAETPAQDEPVELAGTATAGARTSEGVTTRRGTLLREARSWPTVVLALFCLLVGLPVVILLTPQQQLTIAGQHLAVGARTPTLSTSGPAKLVQVGNTELDLDAAADLGAAAPRSSPSDRSPATPRRRPRSIRRPASGPSPTRSRRWPWASCAGTSGPLPA